MYPAKELTKVENVELNEVITIDFVKYIVVYKVSAGANVAKAGWTHDVAARKVSGKTFYSFYWNSETGIISKLVKVS